MVAWGWALASSVDFCIQRMLLDSDFSDWKERGKDPGSVRRLACYLAFVIARESISKHADWFINSDGAEDATSQQMRADFLKIADIMYEPDEVVCRSIEHRQQSDVDFEAGVSTAANALRQGLIAAELSLGVIRERDSR